MEIILSHQKETAMTRIKISAGIILLLILTSIFSGVWINNQCKSIISLSEQTGEIFSDGDKEKAMQIIEQIETKWENFRKTASMLIQNNKLSEIDRICARIKYLAQNDSEELLSELSELKNMLDLLRNGEIPKITSIF